MGVPTVGFHCELTSCLDYALEGRGIVCQRMIEPAVPRGAFGSRTQRKSCKEKNHGFWLVPSSRAVMGDLGCVAQGHLAGLRVFQHSIYDLSNYCMLDASFGAHITPRRFT